MEKKTVQDANLKGKLVFVRCDFNVPLNEDGSIADTTRIDSAIPTIKYLQEQGAKVILASHLGRPKGEVNQKYSMAPVAKSLSEKLNTDVKMAEDVTGPSATQMASNLKEGETMLLENLRFDPREEANEEGFCQELANLGDGIEVYVNDAFGTAHRAHASTEGITKFVEGDKVAGFLMQKEIENLGAVLEKPEKPFVAILGGAKVSDKIGVIENLMKKVDSIIIGGAMANTFLKAKGYDIGDSKYEPEKVEEAKEIMKTAFDTGIDIILPIDGHIFEVSSEEKLTPETVEKADDKNYIVEKGIPAGWQMLDVGEQTLDSFYDTVTKAKTVVWNGPLGYTEAPKCLKGTKAVANIIANSKAKCVIGGGDSGAAMKKIEKENGEPFKNVYISTGGGASLEYLEGKVLPGISCLDNKEFVRENISNHATANGDKKTEKTIGE